MGHLAHAAARRSEATGTRSHSPPLHYERHRPEDSVLYQTLQAHWGTFVERAEEQGGLPKFIVREFEAFLDCGILERGCALFACQDCGATRLLAFSCKRRGFCPSCLGRRMSDVALHLVDHVIPHVPVRQWVCSLPHQLRYLLGYDRKLCAAVVHAIELEVMASYKRRAKRELGLRSVALAHPGAVTFVQRFDSALRLNVHPHMLALDGVYVRDIDSGELSFAPLPEPTQDEMTEVARRIAKRIEKDLRKAGRWFDDETDGASLTDEALEPEDAVLVSCCQAAATGRELLGEEAGQPTSRLKGLPPERPNKRKAGLMAEVRGVNIHADRAIDGRDRKQIERLCRYMARPPLANDRLHVQPDGRLRYTLKRTWSDGTHAVVMDPLTFIGRLCALIPPPRMHMLRFCAVLAAHNKLRAEVVPGCTPVEAPYPFGYHTPSGVTKRVEARPVPEQLALFEHGAVLLPITQQRQDPDTPSRPSRHAWAFLMQHVFAKDVLACPHCEGRLRLVEVAKTTESIARVLADAGIGPRAPPRPQAAWPGQLTLALC